MTAKEKARDLMCKFNFKQNAESGDITFYQTPEESQRCALIAVDEILSVLWHTFNSKELYYYWQEVKQEINNL